MGQWLEAAGFHIGDPVLVKCEDGKLVISLDTARAELMEAEKAFDANELSVLDPKYFSIIFTDAFDVMIMSRNTGHFWFIHNPEYGAQKTNRSLTSKSDDVKSSADASVTENDDDSEDKDADLSIDIANDTSDDEDSEESDDS